MIKITRFQRGSTHVVIVIILVVLLAGSLGFIFWQNFINKPATPTKTDAITTKESTKEKTATDTNEGFTVLTDWSVRFKSNSQKYTLTKKSTDDNIEYYYVSSNEVKALCGDNEAASAYIGVITRYSPDTILGGMYDNMTASEAFANATDKVVTSKYLYVLTGPQSACTDDNAAMSQVTASVAELKTQFKTLEDY